MPHELLATGRGMWVLAPAVWVKVACAIGPVLSRSKKLLL